MTTTWDGYEYETMEELEVIRVRLAGLTKEQVGGWEWRRNPLAPGGLEYVPYPSIGAIGDSIEAMVRG